MTIEELKKKKIELGYSNRYIAETTGLPVGTVQKFFSGGTKAPRLETVSLIYEVLMSPSKRKETEQEEKEKEMRKSMLTLKREIKNGQKVNDEVKNQILSELVATEDGSLIWNGKETGFTYRDYLELSDVKKVELIDGKLYHMPTSDLIHQLILGEIMIAFDTYIESRRKRDVVAIQPFDVLLNQDEKTVLRPDIIMVCNQNRVDEGLLWGAPDLVVEVMTPETAKRDYILKHYKYGISGVKEYWLVNPLTDQITVYLFEGADYETNIYHFYDQVPVSVWRGKCTVDFSLIKQRMNFLKEPAK